MQVHTVIVDESGCTAESSVALLLKLKPLNLILVGDHRQLPPMFRERDRESMEFAFDLWSYDDVSENADGILARVKNGSMRNCASGTPSALRNSPTAAAPLVHEPG